LSQPKKLIFGDSPSVKTAKNLTETFKIKSKIVHGKKKYNYSSVKYLANDKKVKIFCNECKNFFKQNPSSHLNGSGCSKCKSKLVGQKKVKNRAKTISIDISKIHGDKIKLDNFIYNGANKKSKFGCGINKMHGYWVSTPSNILQGKGCPSCKLSKGERLVETCLNKNNIKHKKQHRFTGCKNILPLPFDFYLPKHNICIEFNGRHHYESVAAFGGNKSFNAIKVNDEIKKEYCIKNNIKLLSIPYYKIKNIDSLINHFLFANTT
jgi:hypothetical protein